MKDEYLNKLKEELEKNNIPDRDNIYQKYEKRYNFGLEASMKDEEIEEKLGTVESIIEKEKEKAKQEIVENKENKIYDLTPLRNLNIKVAGDSVNVLVDSSINEVKFNFEDVKEKDYEITNDDKDISLTYKDRMFAFNKKENDGLITVLIPQNMIFNEVNIKNTSGDFSLCEIKANKVNIKNVSGDLYLPSLNSSSLEVNNTSGDVQIDKALCTDIELNNVSGDINVNYLKGQLKISNISGDIQVENFLGTSKVTNVSGDVSINGDDSNTITETVTNTINNVGRKVKEFFTK